MLAQMRKAIGFREPNPVHAWYGKRNGAVFADGDTPWCQMTITWAAWHSGNYDAVCPNGDRAYTVWSAEDGDRQGRWHAGTVENIRRHAKPGAIVYIDWAGANRLAAIDHVGVIERVLPDGRVQTIEGNTADVCARRVRSADVIAGFWNPDYEEDDVSAKELWQHELAVPFGSKENPSWQVGNIVVNNAKWTYEMRSTLAQLGAKLDAQTVTIQALAEALKQRDDEIDVQALVERIERAIEGVKVELNVTADA